MGFFGLYLSFWFHCTIGVLSFDFEVLWHVESVQYNPIYVSDLSLLEPKAAFLYYLKLKRVPLVDCKYYFSPGLDQILKWRIRMVSISTMLPEPWMNLMLMLLLLNGYIQHTPIYCTVAARYTHISHVLTIFMAEYHDAWA